ncbi:MAG: hypothetical protein AB8G14_03510 [Ilumatobacter sp.]
MAPFDRVVVVDWSANSTPKLGRDSIWVAEFDVAAGSIRSANISTRSAAIDLLVELSLAPGRCLVGVDFSLGFPAGFAAALGLVGTPWSATWELLAAEIEDSDRNANNRFEVASSLNARVSPGAGPFWGCHPSRASEHLTTKKVGCAPLGEWRTVEALLRTRGRRPFSSWQLLGAGAVGSQSLLGVASMSKLLPRVSSTGRSIDVWPFTTGIAVPAADTVLAEVWPTLVDLPDTAADIWDSRVRDQVQVETLASYLGTADLAALFVPPVPTEARQIVECEEGWVLGA